MVMSKPQGPSPEEEVDQRAEELMKEFLSHYKDCVDADASVEGRRCEVFEAWMFQKLAGLQLSIEHLARAVSGAPEGE